MKLIREGILWSNSLTIVNNIEKLFSERISPSGVTWREAERTSKIDSHSDGTVSFVPGTEINRVEFSYESSSSFEGFTGWVSSLKVSMSWGLSFVN